MQISSFPLFSPDGGFSGGQQIQRVERRCTNITFNVYSPLNSEMVNLYADSPCGSSMPSIRQLDIQFNNCTCSVRFKQLSSDIKCDCICDFKLSPYITDCNSTTESLVRVNTNSWITYINGTYQPGYIIHPNCPFDYCQLSTENISMNLNLPHGADAQCAFNHSGLLCGACREKFSLSLGSSRCLPCHSYWLFIGILLTTIIAGTLLVIALLTLKCDSGCWTDQWLYLLH